jgi:hypothetical protein
VLMHLVVRRSCIGRCGTCSNGSDNNAKAGYSKSAKT